MTNAMLYATLFYNSKIFIPYELAGLLRKDDFNLRKRLFHIKKLDIQNFYWFFIPQVKP